MLRAGFAEVDITPELGLPMAGMIGAPLATGVKWPLFGRVAVFNDGRQQVAVVSLDLVSLMPSTVKRLRLAMAANGDLAPTNVMIACSHTHRGPHTSHLMEVDADFAYLDLLQDRIVASARAALASLRPVRLRVGNAHAPGWTFNRRPIYRGEQVGTHGPEGIPDFVRMEGPADAELQVLTATDSQGRIVGGLVNYACHTTVMVSEPVFSADFAGALTAELARRHGGIFCFLQGAAGQLSPDDPSKPAADNHGSEHAQRMATALADKADEALAEGQLISDPSLRIKSTWLRIPQRKASQEQAKLARWYLEKAPADLDQREFTRRMYGHDYTFYQDIPEVQEWFAREAIGMWEWQRRTDLREFVERVEVQAIAIGDVAVVGFPAEMFTEFGLRTKKESPFRQTLIVELANGWFGYVPTLDAFAHGGYEPRFGYHSRLAPEAGDRMTDAALRLLRRLSR